MSISPRELMATVLERLTARGYRSWDHYDYWGSPSGIWLRRHRNPLTLPLIGAAYYGDLIFPRLFRFGMAEQVPMETLPHAMHAMAVYQWATGDTRFEKDRENLLRHMLDHMRPTANGAGVGHHFDWFTTSFIPAFTPCVPLSWYLAEELLCDHPDRYRDELERIGGFIYHDLNQEELPSGARRVSYTPLDRRWIINANSYAARALNRLGTHFHRPEWNARAVEIVSYVLSQQQDDGGWWYFDKDSVPRSENFIDCFHSAFVLENLIPWADEGHAGAMAALERGMAWFSKTFVRPDGSALPFAASHLPVTIVQDIRACAAAIHLFAAMGRRNAAYAAKAHATLEFVMRHLYDGAGGFYFRQYRLFTSRMNYARWGAMPMLRALAAIVEVES